MAQKEIPCYLFVGMLESGKTKFIQETMEDPQFDSGDKTLLLIGGGFLRSAAEGGQRSGNPRRGLWQKRGGLLPPDRL